jgi:hypothetical protein
LAEFTDHCFFLGSIHSIAPSYGGVTLRLVLCRV